MKSLPRLLAGAACLAALLAPPRSAAQETTASRANAIADRDEAEERYRRLDSAVQNLTTSQIDLNRRLEEFDQHLQRVATEAANASTRASGNYITREEFTKLVETVREIDRKREADKQQILDRIRDLGKDLAGMVASSARRPAPAPSPAKTNDATDKASPGPNANQEGSWHTVAKGDTLAGIVGAYNEEYRKRGGRTSMKLVQEANPKMKPNTLLIGQKVFVPFVKSTEK